MDSLQTDPLELSNLLTDNQCDTEWTEKPLKENDFETIFLSESEATNINNLRNQSIPNMLRQTIESIQKDNPQIETIFVDSESEGDCNETQTDLNTLIDDDSATDDAVDDSATDDASETAEFDDHNSIEFIGKCFVYISLHCNCYFWFTISGLLLLCNSKCRCLQI